MDLTLLLIKTVLYCDIVGKSVMITEIDKTELDLRSHFRKTAPYISLTKQSYVPRYVLHIRMLQEH
jgi:hypothetical protein